jgi:hypothetical protein
MQVAPLTKDELRAQIHRAFDDVPIPTRIEDMMLAAYKDSEDLYEMVAELVGKRWQEIPRERLFYHRESLAMLSAVAYRAYLPAYLEACLATDDWQDKYGADVRGYLVTSLAVFPHHQSEARVTTHPERLSLLDDAQREVVANVLRYLEAAWRMQDASYVLESW